MTRLWLDLEGDVIPVADNLSHEEHAQAMGCELEELLAKGWVRIVSVIPPLLYFDFHLPLTAAQGEAVRVLFQNRFDKIVVEFKGEATSFTDSDAALGYAIDMK